MKTRTILKTIGWFIGWIISFQLIPVATSLMNQPSNLAFTFGMLASVTIIGTVLYFVWKFSFCMAELLKESAESRKIKQEKQVEVKQQ